MLLFILGTEAEGRPGEGTLWGSIGGGRYIFCIRVGGGEGGVLAGGVVVAAAGWVGESVIGVVDLLKFLGAGGALGGVGRDPVRVRFEGLSVGGGVSEGLPRRTWIIQTFCMRRESAVVWL